MNNQTVPKAKTNYPPKNFEPKEIQLLKEVKANLGEEYESILKEEKDYNKFTERVKGFMKDNVREITTSQLRNIFSKVKKIKEPKQLYLLRPKLAYVYGRADKDGMKRLLVLLDDQIKQVTNTGQLEEFKSFFESIIAYHKFYGGKD